jgi:hypothetical protein
MNADAAGCFGANPLARRKRTCLPLTDHNNLALKRRPYMALGQLLIHADGEDGIVSIETFRGDHMSISSFEDRDSNRY